MLVEHMLFISGMPADLFVGDYNNFRSELLESTSALYEFRPDIVIVLPDEQSCKYTGRLTDPLQKQEEAVARHSAEILELCAAVNRRTPVEVILCNYMLPPYFDLGPYRARTMASDWSFKKAVNLTIGTKAPHLFTSAIWSFWRIDMVALPQKMKRHGSRASSFARRLCRSS